VLSNLKKNSLQFSLLDILDHQIKTKQLRFTVSYRPIIFVYFTRVHSADATRRRRRSPSRRVSFTDQPAAVRRLGPSLQQCHQQQTPAGNILPLPAEPQTGTASTQYAILPQCQEESLISHQPSNKCSVSQLLQIRLLNGRLSCRLQRGSSAHLTVVSRGSSDCRSISNSSQKRLTEPIRNGNFIHLTVALLFWFIRVQIEAEAVCLNSVHHMKLKPSPLTRNDPVQPAAADGRG